MTPARALALALAVLAASTVALAAAFGYRHLHGAVTVAPPVVWFEDPGVSGVVVRLFQAKTAAEVNVSATPSLERVQRSAVYFDTFDTNPFPARMANVTCSWYHNATAGAVAISVTSRGPSTWGYSCIAVVNLDVSGYAMEGRRLYVAFLTWRTSFGDARTLLDAAFYVNTTAYRAYAIGYNVTLLSGRTGDNLTSSIAYWNGTAWVALASRHLGVGLTLEYLYLSQVAAVVDFGTWRLEHWNVTMLSWAEAAPVQRFYPNRVGIGFWINATTAGTIFYDNLVVTVDREPWLVNVTGLPDGWVAVLRSAAGREVARATSSGGVAVLPVWAPLTDLNVTAGFRDGFIFPNATIEVYDTSGRLVASGRFDYVVGGDVYRLRYIFDGPVLNVYSNSSAFTARLTVEGASCSPGVNASLGLLAHDGRATHVNVTVVNGVVTVNETGALYVGPPADWSGSWFAMALRLSTALPPTSTCTLELRYAWWVGEGAVAVYPVRLTIKA